MSICLQRSCPSRAIGGVLGYRLYFRRWHIALSLLRGPLQHEWSLTLDGMQSVFSQALCLILLIREREKTVNPLCVFSIHSLSPSVPLFLSLIVSTNYWIRRHTTKSHLETQAYMGCHYQYRANGDYNMALKSPVVGDQSWPLADYCS